MKPIIFLSYLDVVPIEKAIRSKWKEIPFSRIIKDNLIWGRGSVDDKSSLIAIMESVELLLAEGYQTSRTIYLAFGHDEKIGGGGATKPIEQIVSIASILIPKSDIDFHYD